MGNITSNRVSQDMTDLQKTTVIADLVQVETELPWLIGLNVDERVSIPKINATNRDFVADADKRSMQFLVNDELIPRMIKHGFTVLNNLRFEFAPVKNLKAQMEMVTAIMPYMNVDEKYVQETFGIPVSKKENAPVGEPNKKPVKLSLKEKQKLLENASIVNLHAQLKKIYLHQHE